MINLRKIRKYICLIGLLLFCFLCSDRVAIGEGNTVTMTEYDASAAARQSALSGKIVTISNLEEFRLFQSHLNESENGLAGISFRQEADITPGDYHFTYDEDVDRYWIDRENNRIGAVDRAGVVYKADGVTVSSVEALGLSDLILQTWDDAKWFAGTYDGQGHFFRGFLLGIIDNQGSTYGGLFCDLAGGTIRNVNVSDCCMHHCMSPLVNAMLDGTIENCNVSDIVGAADASGGIAGLLWRGTIQDCEVERCIFRFRQGYQEGEIYGGIGGVVGIMEQNGGAGIRNCQVTDTILYGADFSKVGTGGIAGIVNTAREGSISISDCSASVVIYGGKTAGGILGRVQRDGTGTVSIQNCVCSGSILEGADSSGSDVGGIVGRVGMEVSQITITDCISLMAIEKCSEKRRGMGTAGGVAGSVQGSCVIDDTVFAGCIREKETVGNRGQRNSAGGIVGELAAEGNVVNCVNFADIWMGDSQENICGGLVGLISADYDVKVANSLTLGKIIGKISGGLVGMLDAGEAVYQIDNALFLGELAGELTGNLAGEALSGSFSYCYGRCDMAQAFGNGALEMETCRQVSTEQLAGTEQFQSIFDEGELAGIFSVKEVLNYQANQKENRKMYALWDDTQVGYPLMSGMEDFLSFALRELDKEWDLPQLPDRNPSSSATPPEKETPAPTGQETQTPTPTPSEQEVPTPTPTPSEQEVLTPTPTPSGQEVPTPTPTPSGQAMPTPTPSEQEVPTPAPSGQGLPTPMPSGQGTPTPSPSGQETSNKQAVVAGFRGKSRSNKYAVLTWEKNTQVTGYYLYRSLNKSSGYRVIKQCTTQTTRFQDRKCKPGKKYYYQIRAIYLQNGKFYQGKASRCTVKLPYLRTPTFRLSKGKNDYGEKYLQITMGKYAGKYVDVYIKKANGHYKKASMASHKIAAYRDIIRFTYRRSGVKYWCKIRTYKIVKGKKRYSGYSKAKKIWL